MDYQKIDAALAAALDDIQDPEARVFEVFIHVAYPLSPDEAGYLQGLGVHGDTSGRQVLTATLSARAVAELSDQAWVRHLRLSRKLRLLNPDDA
jgi:hypothetical protein